MSQSEERATLEAFGSTALVAVTDAGALGTARAVVERIVAEFDQACSRFRDDSELSAVNAAGGAAVPVGPVLLEAVTVALRAARLTDGDVDPTVGQALISLGYDRDFDLLSPARPGHVGPPASRPIAAIPGWRTVTVDPERSTIRLAGGVRLDLGATAKALAADRAAAEASAAAGCGVLVSFGGDLAIAGPAPAEGWMIRVTDDHRSGFDAPGQWIALSAGALATSSTAVRRWRTGSGMGMEGSAAPGGGALEGSAAPGGGALEGSAAPVGGAWAHHVVDPLTGGSAESVWRTVSVCAGSCLDANIASTATIVRGEKAEPWLEALGLPSRLVRTDGTVRHVAGWPSEGDDLPVGESGPPALSLVEERPSS